VDLALLMAQEPPYLAALAAVVAPPRTTPRAGARDGYRRRKLRRHFTLSEDELGVVRGMRGASNRLGFALQLCALRLITKRPLRSPRGRCDARLP